MDSSVQKCASYQLYLSKINDKIHRSPQTYLSDDLYGEGNHDGVLSAHVLSFDCFLKYPKHFQDTWQ